MTEIPLAVIGIGIGIVIGIGSVYTATAIVDIADSRLACNDLLLS